MSSVQVLTVDDQPLFREVARAVIASTPGFELAGEASSGAEAISVAEELRPDMVILDVRMPGLDGIETARRLTLMQPGTVVILVSGHDPDELVESLAEGSGAAALVVKERLAPPLLQELWKRHAPPEGAAT